MIFWIMLFKGNSKKIIIKYIKAEPPCNKGEINVYLRRYVFLIGWQSK